MLNKTSLSKTTLSKTRSRIKASLSSNQDQIFFKIKVPKTLPYLEIKQPSKLRLGKLTCRTKWGSQCRITKCPLFKAKAMVCSNNNKLSLFK